MDMQFDYDISDLERVHRYFSGKDWENVQKRALNQAAKTLKKDIRDRFKNALPAATHKNPKYKDRLIDAIRNQKAKNTGPGEWSVRLHAYGSPTKGSRTYQARFFENKTEERFTKSGWKDKWGRKYGRRLKRGTVGPLDFFKNGIKNADQALQSTRDMLID